LAFGHVGVVRVFKTVESVHLAKFAIRPVGIGNAVAFLVLGHAEYPCFKRRSFDHARNKPSLGLAADGVLHTDAPAYAPHSDLTVESRLFVGIKVVLPVALGIPEQYLTEQTFPCFGRAGGVDIKRVTEQYLPGAGVFHSGLARIGKEVELIYPA
jgi:hypothetical protein